VAAAKTRLQELKAAEATGEELYQYEPYHPDDDDHEDAELGVGTFANTYRMRRLADNQLFAVKMIRKKVAKDNVIDPEQLQKEAKVLQLLDHPAIVSYVATCEFKKGKVFAIVTELLEGGSLQTKIAVPSPPPVQVAEWMRHIASGVVHMHSLNILHRDLKPDNVLFDATGHVKIIDLGLACIVSSQALAARTRLTKVGAETYMSPEKYNNHKRDEYGPPDDVWALGCMLAELLLGELLDTVATDKNEAKFQDKASMCTRAHATLGSYVGGCLSYRAAWRPTAVQLEQGLDAVAQRPEPAKAIGHDHARRPMVPFEP